MLCFFLMSPIYSALNIKGVYFLIALLMLIMMNGSIRANKFDRSMYYLFLILIITSLISSLYNDSLTPFVFSCFFVLTGFVVLQSDREIIDFTIHYATLIFFVFIAGAFLSVFYYNLGGNYLFYLINPDGRENFFYLTGFSNSVTFTIRPSAIYDEPGAFSFYICLLVAMRSRLQMPAFSSSLLMLGGLITQSIAHILFLFIWLLWLFLSIPNHSISNKKIFLFRVLIFIVFLVCCLIFLNSYFFEWAINRAAVYYESPELNPRYISLINVNDLIKSNLNNFFFGFDQACINRSEVCGGYGENILTPLIYGGILVAWPYYLFLVFSLSAIFKSVDGLLVFGVAMLLWQRPYLQEFPYSAAIILLCVIWFIPHRNPTRSFFSSRSLPLKFKNV